MISRLGENFLNIKKEVEHILPIKFDNWRNDFTEEDHELLVDTFANLVILSDKLNKEVSNKPYIQKRAHIRDNAMFLSTRKLFDENENWKPEDIRKRAESLSQWAVKRFPC